MEKVHTFVSGGKRYPVEDVETSEALAREAERSQASDREFAEQMALLGNKISAEKLRAEGAEQNLQTAINDEAARAAKVENIISVALRTEGDRAKEAEKALDEKIDKEVEAIKDGDTIVGQAREVYSRTGKTVTDSFLARTTAGSGTIGDGVASLKSVGGNIVKNMVDGTFESGWIGRYTVANGVSFVKPYTTFDGTSFLVESISSHKYYVSACINTPAHIIMRYGADNYSQAIDKWHTLSNIVTNVSHNRISFICTNTAVNFFVCKPLIIDLTEMFGAGKEPDKDTCDRLFGTMDDIPQGLTIANPTEFKSVGYNQFNPENVLKGKTIDENGAIVDSTTTDIAVIPCLPCKVGTGENNGYCVHGEFGDDIKVYLTPLNPMEVEGELYMHELTPDATKGTYVPQIKGCMLIVTPSTHNLCIHFLWSEDRDKHDYEPYHESKVALPTIPQMSEYGLAGIQSRGTLACDEIDFERGVYIKRIGAVDLGSLSWTAPDENNLAFLSSVVKDIKLGDYNKVNNLICKPFTVVHNHNRSNPRSVENSIWVHGDHRNRICVQTSKYTDSTSIKAALQGTMLYYELAELEEYPLPEFDNNYISSDYGVEQFDSTVPCNANNLYYMRSLVGETRNFLDRMYDNTEKTDAKEVADYITNNLATNIPLATTENDGLMSIEDKTKLDSLSQGDIVVELMKNVTYNELVELRDNSNLVPGSKYRITDYITTTVQENTKSANHPFDIIVEAISENELSELAQAIQHEEDTYFNGNDLGAWQLWYNLDNDTNKYAWADAENGKGVIYRMIDEHGNDCPYDFKNILFIRYKLNAPDVGGYTYEWQDKMSENINKMFEKKQLSYIWHGNNNEDDYYWEDDMGEVISSPTGETKAFFTFSNVVNDIVTDKSITSVCHNNIIKESRDGSQLRLNNIVFFSIYESASCYSNSFGNSCYSNSFGNSCYSNSFGNYYNSNSFGNDCYYNSFGNYCNSNSFGNYCYYNSFGNSCYYNSFGNYCYYNSFGNDCNSNSFGNYCYSNSFGNSCNSNSFGNSCYSNSFGNDCNSNSFGNYCNSNSFGNSCYSNSFGNDCYSNSFGNDCNSNSFRDGSAYDFNEDYWQYSYEDNLIDGVRGNKFGDRCQNLLIHTHATTGEENSIQNLNIAQGLSSIELDDNDVFIPLPIEIDIVGQSCELKIGRDSNDEIKVYCEADLV